MKPRSIACAVMISAMALTCGMQVANAQEAPKDNKGFTASKTTVVELGPEIGHGGPATSDAHAHHRTWRLYRHS